MRFIFWAIALCACIATGAAYAEPASTRSAGGDCQTELKPTDGYRELSAMLKCLDDRIKALETARPAGAPRGATEIAPPASVRRQILQNGTLQADLKKCGWWQKDGNLYCSITLTNRTKEDRTACLGPASRLLTDTGSSYALSGGFDVIVGSAVGSMNTNQQDPVCDTIPPLSRIEAWVRFWNAGRKGEAEVQFLRVDCGKGCTYEAYKIPIE
jgi:hypothetical protein